MPRIQIFHLKHSLYILFTQEFQEASKYGTITLEIAGNSCNYIKRSASISDRKDGGLHNAL